MRDTSLAEASYSIAETFGSPILTTTGRVQAPDFSRGENQQQDVSSLLHAFNIASKLQAIMRS